MSCLATLVVAVATVPVIAWAFPASLPHMVDVWLPSDYPAQARGAVPYRFDDQMLFDAAETWNHQSWRDAIAYARGI